MICFALRRFKALTSALVAVSAIFAAPLYGTTRSQQPAAQLADGSSLVTLSAEVADVDVPGKGLIKGLYVYRLRGPGMSSGAPAALMPPVIAAARGRTLTIDFFTKLPEETNLHTHGLSITPRGVGFGESGSRPLYGDCILVNGEARNAPPSPNELAKVDPCKPQTEAPASVKEAQPVRYRDVIPPHHPSGLFWFHPHVHGVAEKQVLAGLSGLLTIGDIWDYAYFECWAGDGLPPSGAAACDSLAAQRRERALEQAADIRFIGLKDLQIDQDDTGGWALHDPLDYQKDRCGGVTWDPAAPQDLQRKAQLVLAPGGTGAPGGCWTDPKRQWMFTVSGEVYPTLTAPPGSVQIWRVANMSADVTYRLRVETKDKDAPLCPGSRAGMSETAQHHCLALAELSRDGVPLDSGGASGQSTLELTLMPSARAEVYVPRCTGAQSAVSAKDGCLATDRQIEAKLVTAGVAVGDSIDAADIWPPVELARVIAEPGDLSRLTAIAGRAPAKAAAWLHSAGYGPADLAPAPTESGGAPAMREDGPAPQLGGGVAQNCDPAHTHYSVEARDFSKYGAVVRLVRFNNSDQFTDGDERFGLHVENFRLHDGMTGKPIHISELLDRTAGSRKLARVNLRDDCQTKAVEDASGKTFAFYYPRFPMSHDSQPDPIGAPLVHSWRSDRPEYWLLVNDSHECHNFHIHQTKFEVAASDVVRGETGESQDQCLGDRDPKKLASRTALHDNFPLPPGARILLRIAFGPDQLGRFVFHCHILEHEDKGMMTLLQVEERGSRDATRAAATSSASGASAARGAARRNWPQVRRR
ncbi:MAG: multicopper oxidase domain-containing protein [Methylocystis sp.]|uniref:multicopper oxidase domain-containing protein n=1 Tax=Methylocystis sp. TaxID=1911079 RepID=UPI003D1241B6